MQCSVLGGSSVDDAGSGFSTSIVHWMNWVSLVNDWERTGFIFERGAAVRSENCVLNAVLTLIGSKTSAKEGCNCRVVVKMVQF